MRADEPHQDVQALLDQLAALDVFPLSQYPVDVAREVSTKFRSDSDGPAVGDVTDRSIPGPGGDIPVRVYRPDGDGPFPTLIYFHGGGWVIGGLDSHDVLCRHLTNAVEAVVASVDYRLAPEHPFPAAVEDAYAVTEWAAANPEEFGSDGRLAVAGDSAGGTLSAVVSLLARDRDGPALAHQGLIYPATSADDDWPSREENAEGYFLSETDMDWFGEQYFESDIAAANPYAFPLNACDLSGLPPATVLTAGFDPLRDEGTAYAERLAAAGVPVEQYNYDDMIHGFVGMLAPPADLDSAHEAVADLAADLRSSFEG